LILGEWIPVIQEELRSEIANGVQQTPVILIFDGSCRLGEALAIVMRYLDDDWNIKTVLGRFEVLQKSMNAQELANRLNNFVMKTICSNWEHVTFLSFAG